MKDLLTPLANELAELLGVQRALALIEKFGGVKDYVPKVIPETHELREILGDKADLFAETYGGDTLRYPRAAAFLRQKRDAEMVAAHRQEGASSATLARRYQMTERQVWRILAEAPPDRRQGTLF